VFKYLDSQRVGLANICPVLVRDSQKIRVKKAKKSCAQVRAGIELT